MDSEHSRREWSEVLVSGANEDSRERALAVVPSAAIH